MTDPPFLSLTLCNKAGIDLAALMAAQMTDADAAELARLKSLILTSLL